MASRFNFDPEDPEAAVELCILGRKGEAQAITIDQIALKVWPYRWFQQELGKSNVLDYPYRPRLRRTIKAAVRKLRRLGRKIGSCRGSKKAPPGYYMIVTSDELAATVRPMLRQAVDELRTIEALTGKGFFTAELEGQQRLFQV